MEKKYIILILFIFAILTIIACSNMVSRSNNTKTVSGQIVEVSNSAIIILSENNEKYSITINNKTKFKGNVSNGLSIGDGVAVLFNGIVSESDPMQITAMEITVDEHSNQSAQLRTLSII